MLYHPPSMSVFYLGDIFDPQLVSCSQKDDLAIPFDESSLIVSLIVQKMAN